MSRLSKLATWLNNEVEKDKKDLENYKKILVNQISSIEKKELFKKDKLTFWERIKKVFF